MSAPWELHQKTLRHLYLERKMKVKDMVAHMRITYGFDASESEYERQLNAWGFRKNLKKRHWKHIILQVEKRKRDGKESEVTFDGVLVPMEKIQKRASSKYGHTTVWEKEQARLQLDKRSPTPEGITIRTPKHSVTLCFDTLPWVQFQQLFQARALVSDNLASENGFSLQDIGSLLSHSPIHQQLIDAMLPSEMAESQFVSVSNNLQLSGRGALMLAALFHTNRVIHSTGDMFTTPKSWFPWIKTITQHSGTAGSSILFQLVLASNSPTVDALSEIIFKEALLSENVEVARLLLDYAKVDPNALIPGPWPDQLSHLSVHGLHGPQHPMKVAMRSRNIEMVQLLLNHYPRAIGLLLAAIKHGTSEILKAVVSSEQADLSACFIEFVQHQDVPAVERLLESGVSANTRDAVSGYTALIGAVIFRNHQLTELLIKEGADVNLSTQNGMTALHVAAFHNSLEIAKLLLVNLVQIDDPYNRPEDLIRIPTPLQIAVYRNHLDMTALLLEYGANLNAPNPKIGGMSSCRDLNYLKGTDGLTTLRIALNGQQDDMIRLLLDHHMSMSHYPIEPRNEANNYSGYILGGFVLEEALSPGDQNTIRRVLNSDIPLFPDAFRAAVVNADFEIMQCLLDKGANINHLYRNSTTVLTAAIIDYKNGERRGEPYSLIRRVCTFLLDRGADINCKGACPTALQAATELIHLDLVKFLVERGAYIGHKENGPLLLARAIETCDQELVQLLVKQGMDVNHHWHFTKPLHRAITRSGIDIVKFLVQSGADVNNNKCPEFEIPVAIAIQEKKKDVIRFLIKHGARCDIAEVLSSAAGNCNRALFEEIITAAQSGSPDFDSRIRESCLGHPAFFTAIEVKNGAILEALLLLNINLQSPCMIKAMTLLCLQRNVPLMRILHSAGVPVNAASVSSCMREGTLQVFIDPLPLYSAVKRGFKEEVDLLLELGADPNLSLSSLPYSVLCEVLRCMSDSSAPQAYLEIFEALIEAGADVNRAAVGNLDRTALQMAVEIGNGEVVDRLIDAGADIHAPPASCGGVTALQAAAIGGYLGIAVKLIKRGAYVDAQGAKWDGRTALEGAAEHGRLDMVQLLLNAGAGTSPLTGKQQYENAVKMARRRGHNSVAKLIETHQETNGLRCTSDYDMRKGLERSFDLLYFSWFH